MLDHFDLFTDKARRVVFFARYEAALFDSEFIKPDHLLLGTVREEGSIITTFFPRGTFQYVLFEEMRNIISTARVGSVDRYRDFSEEADALLKRAVEIALEAGHGRVCVRHLLIALLEKPEWLLEGFAKILAENGITAQAVRQKLLNSSPRFATETVSI